MVFGIAILSLGTLGTSATASAFAFSASCKFNGEKDEAGNDDDDKNIPEVHRSDPIRLTRVAKSHAIAHCQKTTPRAHRRPSSRLIAATDATHGV